MFEWDESKRRANIAKHGIDFTDAARLVWNSAVTVEDIRRDYGETRYVAIGRIGHTVCVVCYTSGPLH